MGDGWETARKMTRPPVLEPDAQGLIKVPGSDFALLRLGTPGVVEVCGLVGGWLFFGCVGGCQDTSAL